MTQSVNKRLADLFQSLHHQAFEEVKPYWGYSSPAISNYAAGFTENLPDQTHPTSYADLLASAANHQVVLFGDFHAFGNSQETFVKLISDFQKSYPDKKIAIGLEMNRASDQKSINDFLSGKINELTFLKQIEYQKHWGFLWDNFKPIFELAKETHAYIFGVNSDESNENDITARDKFTANQIKQYQSKHPEQTIFILIGEYHLAPKHLPQALKQASDEISTLSILCNTDKYSLAQDHLEYPQYYSIENYGFCIVNSPSWLKWHSLNLWAEPKRKNLTRKNHEDED